MARQLQNMKRFNSLLLGKTGHGKSSTGNAILGYRKFKTSSSTTSMTGIIGQGLVKLGTFQERKRIDDDYLRKLGVVVVPGSDEFESNLADDEEEDHPETFMKWREQENEAFGGVLTKSEYRFESLDIETRDVGKKERQLSELIRMSRRILASSERYTSESFQVIAEQRDKPRRLHPHEKLQIKVDLIEKAVYNVSTQPSQQTTKILKQKIQGLLDDIDAMQVITQDLQNLKDLAERMKSAANSLLETLRQEIPDQATMKKRMDQIDELWEQMKINEKTPSNYINTLVHGCRLMLSVAGVGGIYYLVWSGKCPFAAIAMKPAVKLMGKEMRATGNAARMDKIVRLIVSNMDKVAPGRLAIKTVNKAAAIAPSPEQSKAILVMTPSILRLLRDI